MFTPAIIRRGDSELRSAFTLIELLVAISILTVLAAIMMPVLGTVRAAAYASRCAGQQGQIAMGISVYAEAWDGYLPYGYIGTAATPSFRSWADLLTDQADALNSVYNCPANRGTRWTPGTQWNFSYLANLHYWTPTDMRRYGVFSESTQSPVSLASIHPGTLLIADGSAWYKFVFITATAVVDDTTGELCWRNTTGAFPGKVVARHKRRIAASFADGHVGTLTLEEMTATPNPAASPVIYPMLTRTTD